MPIKEENKRRCVDCGHSTWKWIEPDGLFCDRCGRLSSRRTVECAPGEANIDGCRVKLEQPTDPVGSPLYLTARGDTAWLKSNVLMYADVPLYRALPIEDSEG